jgi:hypothetical protein
MSLKNSRHFCGIFGISRSVHPCDAIFAARSPASVEMPGTQTVVNE